MCLLLYQLFYFFLLFYLHAWNHVSLCNFGNSFLFFYIITLLSSHFSSCCSKFKNLSLDFLFFWVRLSHLQTSGCSRISKTRKRVYFNTDFRISTDQLFRSEHLWLQCVQLGLELRTPVLPSYAAVVNVLMFQHNRTTSTQRWYHLLCLKAVSHTVHALWAVIETVLISVKMMFKWHTIIY